MPVVAREQLGAPTSRAVAARLDHELADGRGIAQAEVQSLRADRRDDMRGLADQRDAVAPRSCARSRSPSGNRPRPSSTATLPRIECARRSISRRERGRVERAETLGLGRIDHADEARAQAGQGHQRERAALGVELGRDAVVRPRVAEIEGERRLRIARAARSRCRRRRGRATCARRRRPRAAPRSLRRRRAGPSRRHRPARPPSTAAAMRRRRGSAAARAVERRDQMAVLDIVAERLEPDLGRLEQSPRARGSAAACRRSGGSRSAARPRRGTAARPRAPPAPRPSRTAARWCGCRPAAAVAISAVSTPAAASAIAAVSPAGPPPTTATSTDCACPWPCYRNRCAADDDRDFARRRQCARNGHDAVRPERSLIRRRSARARAAELLAIACIAVLAAAGWIYLGLMLAGSIGTASWRRCAGRPSARRRRARAAVLVLRDVVRDGARHDAADRRPDDH